MYHEGFEFLDGLLGSSDIDNLISETHSRIFELYLIFILLFID